MMHQKANELKKQKAEQRKNARGASVLEFIFYSIINRLKSLQLNHLCRSSSG